MSPAHLHQYAASISPGQLSESLPSSQVNEFKTKNNKFFFFDLFSIFLFEKQNQTKNLYFETKRNKYFSLSNCSHFFITCNLHFCLDLLLGFFCF
jgi:hypothetical protein